MKKKYITPNNTVLALYVESIIATSNRLDLNDDHADGDFQELSSKEDVLDDSPWE